jgi:transposase
VCDASGWLIAVLLSPGQIHESLQFEALMERIEIRSWRGPAKRRPQKLTGDKAYSSRSIRRWLAAHGIEAVIPRRTNEGGHDRPFDRESYRARNIVERTIGWLKEFRRIATRYEKLAVHYQGMITVAMILQYLTY